MLLLNHSATEGHPAKASKAGPQASELSICFSLPVRFSRPVSVCLLALVSLHLSLRLSTYLWPVPFLTY